LRRALAEDPAERFADAGEFAKMLQQGLITGTSDPAPPRRAALLTKLQIWQLLAALFAAGFFILLARSLR
jgi:hypothetical protein